MILHVLMSTNTGRRTRRPAVKWRRNQKWRIVS